MTRQRGVIFDVDGVLVESYDAHLGSWQALGAERGFTFTEQQFLETFGRTTREILAETYGAERFADGEIAELDAHKEAIFRDILASDFPVMDGAVALIDALSAAGYLLAVGSSGPPENVQFVLQALDRVGSFQGVVTGEDVTRGKPDPQVFLIAAERLNLPPRDCLVVEDARAGVEAAQRAGTVCVGLVSKGHTFEELAQADHVIGSLRELDAATIDRLLSRGK